MSTASYNCPCCGGPLTFSGKSGKLECVSCGNNFEPEALETLAQKAKFSQHTLTAEELEQFAAYLTDVRHQLEQKPLYLRLVYMYLYAVI